MGENQSRDQGYIKNAGDKAKVVGFLGATAIAGAAVLGGCGDLKNNSQQNAENVNPVPMTETINAGRSEVVINSAPIKIRPETPVGVSGYPNAIPEGGIMTSESGKRFRISYDTKIFPTVTYLHYSEAETPVLGEMGSLFELGDVA
ncbi:MAG: hypothetical protein PHE21_02855, partial [Candidatus Dojkabacteria bacterium]|nr:hypothetical protein [Candidatus Dojkabacteria bacterium]